MLKMVRKFDINVMYDANHARAHYTVDGVHFGNNGDCAEWTCKDSLGLAYEKDASGAYDVTDDIPEINASVKSSNATLVNKVIGHDFDSVIKAYFENVHSNIVWYAIPDIKAKVVTVYQMTMTEFERYLRKFSKFDASRKVIRLAKDSSKNIAWLEYNARG